MCKLTFADITNESDIICLFICLFKLALLVKELWQVEHKNHMIAYENRMTVLDWSLFGQFKNSKMPLNKVGVVSRRPRRVSKILDDIILSDLM